MNTINLAEHTMDATRWSVEQMLEHALEQSWGEKSDYGKAIVLWLNDSDGFDVSFTQAGMHASQMLALLDVAHAMVLEEMGFMERVK